jgi:hypothetical protein
MTFSLVQIWANLGTRTDIGILGGIWNNTPPLIGNLQVTPSSEGSVATLTGNFNQVTAPGDIEVQVNWGDGTDVDTLYYASSSQSFSDQHIYGQSSTNGYPVSVTVTDAENTTSTTTTTAIVSDVRPMLSGLTIMPYSTLDDGEAVLSSMIETAGWAAPLTLNVDWGDQT